MSRAEKIKSITKRIQGLPTLPPVVRKITALVESPDVTAQEVGKLISSDQVLSAKVLKLVNSPFYGVPGRISSISHAVILLGFNVIKGVVLSASVFEIMETSMVGLWAHSLGSAIASGTIARALGISEPEEISTAALLHDIGKVLVRVSLPAEYHRIAQIVEATGRSFRDAETEVLGVDHAEIGLWLSREWGMPERLTVPISLHHEPEAATKFKDRVAVVHIADTLIRAFGMGSGGDPWVGRIKPAAWDAIGMDSVDLVGLMREILSGLEEVENLQL